jgi:hypothetical protein
MREIMSVKLTSLEIAFLTYEQRVQYFLDRAREVHGDRYSYRNMNYVKNKEKINIETEKLSKSDELLIDEVHHNSLYVRIQIGFKDAIKKKKENDQAQWNRCRLQC